jgi:Methyltransferase domain
VRRDRGWLELDYERCLLWADRGDMHDGQPVLQRVARRGAWVNACLRNREAPRIVRMGLDTHDSPRYDRIGGGYASLRREDPRIRARIAEALGDARSVVNVGAGAGSYEPEGGHIVAIEPSDVMAAQRPHTLAPAIRASAAKLPLRDASVDAAMAVLTIHHWD